jgi:hypothetical protein
VNRPDGANPIPSAEEAADVLREAARQNREDPLREGSLLKLPDFGQVVMTGDMHGHRGNFAKLARFAALDRMPVRHVILHELIHQELLLGQPDRSYELLLEAARYKRDHPDQVHFLQSNHELAQLVGQHISKGGRDVIEEFADAVRDAYGPKHGTTVLEAIADFIDSLPLAARTPNRVWLSHSLPNEHELSGFDPDVVRRREFSRDDRTDGGSVYQLVWGRYHSPKLLERLAQAWDVDLFIIGHQPQEEGYAVQHDRLIILSSEHSHGTFLPFDLSRTQTLADLERNIRKFVEVA